MSYSKFLSLVLRHKPQAAGLTLDRNGWVAVEDLLAGCKRAGRNIDTTMLACVVAENNKQRFEFNADGTRIRARQGHSVEVDLGYMPQEPPEFLYHGTPVGKVQSIQTMGILKMRRHAVHMSPDRKTAEIVGARRGAYAVLTIRAKDLHATGQRFYITPNRVWFTEHVPPEFIIDSVWVPDKETP